MNAADHPTTEKGRSAGRRWLIYGLLSLVALVALLGGVLPRVAYLVATPTPTLTPTPTPTYTPTPTPTREPLIPTPLPTDIATSTPLPTSIATTTPLPASADGPADVSTGPAQAPVDARGRVGVGVAFGLIDHYDWGAGAPGWYLQWGVQTAPIGAPDIRFVQMVRVRGDRFAPNLDTIRAVARANPGATWLIGNEPDVIWQDDATPEQYAAVYGVIYPALKAADPTAQVAIGGVSQPTPMRMAYLDRILAAYRERFGAEMPVDVWNVHAFILREERGSWGVDIPPGMAEDTGILYEIADHADMAIFQRQIVDFRRWMAERGLRDKPLIVSEYGVLMPESYGFSPELVSDFMISTFDYFLTARDETLGYPQDDNRLVQAFCWYSAADTIYPTPNLFDPETREITPVGRAFVSYVMGLR